MPIWPFRKDGKRSKDDIAVAAQSLPVVIKDESADEIANE